MKDLTGCVHATLKCAIERDIATDKQALEDAGFVFGPNAGPPNAMDEC